MRATTIGTMKPTARTVTAMAAPTKNGHNHINYEFKKIKMHFDTVNELVAAIVIFV